MAGEPVDCVRDHGIVMMTVFWFMAWRKQSASWRTVYSGDRRWSTGARRYAGDTSWPWLRRADGQTTNLIR